MRWRIGLRLVNWFFQRVLRINGEFPYPMHFTSQIIASRKIKVGEGKTRKSLMVSGGCYIQGDNGIELGNDILFAPGVKIISSNHEIGDIKRAAPPIRIGNNCWIGANAVILPGVTLGNNVIVGAGAVVTKSFPNNVILVGNPARILREI